MCAAMARLMTKMYCWKVAITVMDIESASHCSDVHEQRELP